MKKCSLVLSLVLSILNLACGALEEDLGLQDSLVEGALLAVHNGRTLAIIEGNRTIEACEIEVIDEREKTDHVERLKKKNYNVFDLNFSNMMKVIKACDKLSEDDLHTRLDKEVTDDEVGFFSLIRGIIPGTLWCGVNDIAENYHSLGSNSKVDRCCRFHDHCPDKIKSFSKKQGLLNSTPYTKSNCECDRIFFNCLKNANSGAGNSVGKFYFNFLNLQCIDMRHPEKCVAWQKVETNGTLFENSTETVLEEEEFFNISEEKTFENDTVNENSLKQVDEINPGKIPDYFLPPKTECLEWQPDLKQPPKLTFINNELEF